MTGLAESAGRVLDANWLGASTKPSGHLYPHQWSWDSAFIAIGNAQSGQVDRAVVELGTLFDAQWSTGMIPHMVFDQLASGYFPSAELWGTASIEEMPSGLLTSGMCQPPVHAFAVRRVAAALDPERRGRFLSETFETLWAWHDYLHRERAIGSPLIEIWHPWESGMDNSPVWDSALRRIDPDPDELPVYRRVDTTATDSAERPTADHYDRYVYLLDELRRVEYQPADPTALSFRLCDVLFNALTAHADLELAHIADEIGAPGADELRGRALGLAAAIDAEMWNDDLAIHVDIDRTSGDQVPLRIAGGLMPLLLGDATEHRRDLIETLISEFATSPPDVGGLIVPTVPVSHAAFEADRYWRGPAWVNIMWLLIQGLGAGGDGQLASELRTGVLDLVQAGGCAEYYNVITGQARGADEFSWTAALTLDLLAS